MRKLQISFVVFFVLLAVPLALLLYRTYSNLEQEAFFFYRRAAEGVVRNVGESLLTDLQAEEKRPYTQYRYVHVAPGALPLQAGLNLSPLSTYPVESAIPGLLGYFQIDPDGSFHTPFLPDPARQQGLTVEQRAEREDLQNRIARLVEKVFPRAGSAREEDGFDVSTSRDDGKFRRQLESNVNAQLESKYLEKKKYDSREDQYPAQQRYVKQSQLASATQAKVFDAQSDEKLTPSSSGRQTESESGAPVGRGSPDLETQAPALRSALLPGEEDDITAEVDPFQTTLSDSGWLLFSRRVWLQERRYLQGFAVHLQTFLTAHLNAAMSTSVLPAGTRVLVFYQDRLIEEPDSSPSRPEKPLLLYSSSLPHPFDRLRIALATDSLPHGPGYAAAQALGISLALLLVGGLFAIYRLVATQLELSQKKADFVSAVSHELKTPLSTIRMYGELLVEGWVKDESKLQAYHRYIHEESERLSRLIQNVLQLAELEREGWRVDLVREDPVALVREIVHSLESRLSSAGFHCSLRSEDDVRSVAIDRDAMTQVLINLIDNAIKFSGRGERKEIVIKISQLGDECFIRVRDFGPGIPRRQLKKIFQKFYRIDSEMTRTTPGTGIGLALVQMLTIAMKGNVDVANRQPGVEFTLRFPSA